MRVPVIFACLLALGTGAQSAELMLPPGAPLTDSMVADLVRAELAGRGIAGDFSIDVREPMGSVPNRATVAMRVTLGDLRIDRGSGRFQGRMEAMLPTGESAILSTSGRIERLVELMVPSRAIARGETIAAADLVVTRLPASSVPRDGLADAIELVGRQAVRALAANRPARAGDVAAPWLVRRGEEASTVFRRGGLEISSATVALDNGRRGETIRVRNSASGEVRRAMVVAARRVEVAGGPP